MRTRHKEIARQLEALVGIVYDGDEVSQREWNYAKAMRDWCERFVEVFDDCDEDEVTIFK